MNICTFTPHAVGFQNRQSWTVYHSNMPVGQIWFDKFVWVFYAYSPLTNKPYIQDAVGFFLSTINSKLGSVEVAITNELRFSDEFKGLFQDIVGVVH